MKERGRSGWNFLSKMAVQKLCQKARVLQSGYLMTSVRKPDAQGRVALQSEVMAEACHEPLVCHGIVSNLWSCHAQLGRCHGDDG